MTRFQKAYSLAFLLVAILCWSPSKIAGYVAPFLVLLVLGLFGGSKAFVKHALSALVCVLAAIGLYAAIIPGFIVANAFLSVVTYGGIFTACVIPARVLKSQVLWDRLLRWAKEILVVEGVVGIGQAIYGRMVTGSFDFGNGDYVCGTLNLSLTMSNSFSNPIFVINLVLLGLCVLPNALTSKRVPWHLYIACLAVLLASVVHCVVFVSIAVLCCRIVFRPKPRGFSRYMRYLPVGGLVCFGVLVLSSDFDLLPRILNVLQMRGPRWESVRRSLSNVPGEYPLMPLGGFGPGQFSSRAALIASGLYLGSPVAPREVLGLPISRSVPFETYMVDLLLNDYYSKSTSSIEKPYFSWLSVYTEVGAVGVAFVVLFAGRLLWRLWRISARTGRRTECTCLAACIVFLLLLGFGENYWEIPQALLLGLMVMKVLWARLLHQAERPADNELYLGVGGSASARSDARDLRPLRAVAEVGRA